MRFALATLLLLALHSGGGGVEALGGVGDAFEDGGEWVGDRASDAADGAADGAGMVGGVIKGVVAATLKGDLDAATDSLDAFLREVAEEWCHSSSIARADSALGEPVNAGDACTHVAGLAVDHAMSELTDAINDARNCFEGLQGESTCDEIGVVQACAKTALNAAPAAKKGVTASKSLKGAQKTKYLGRIETAEKTLMLGNKAIEQACGDACESSSSCSDSASPPPPPAHEGGR